MNRATGKSLLLALCIFLAAPPAAHAYVDPGVGAMIWQALVAAGLGAAFYFRNITAWFRGRVPGRRRTDSPADGRDRTEI